MDAFFASVEQLTRPTLRGRPVVVGGLGGRGVVAGASYEARARGAHSAMPTYQAVARIGYRGVVVRPRREVYSAASARVFDVLAHHAEVVEQISVDEAFLEPAELVGAGEEDVRRWCNALRTAIRKETGLPSSMGAGSGKQFAKIGSGEGKPDGVFVVSRHREHDMLHPLGVEKLWGVGPVTEAKLKGSGVATIGEFAELSEADVDRILGGVVGRQLWQLARGKDDRPVQPRAVAKQISAEHTYPTDLLRREEMDAAVARAAADAFRRLQRDGRGARTVTVKLRMADFHIESRSVTLDHATDDPVALLTAARRVMRYPDEVGPVRLVGVGYSGLLAARQDSLFPELEAAGTAVTDTTRDQQDPFPLAGLATGASSRTRWLSTQDVWHPEYGHGWVQGTGHGVVSVRFETRTSGPGRTRSFSDEDADLRAADPLRSLEWEEWLRETGRRDPEEPADEGEALEIRAGATPQAGPPVAAARPDP